MAEIMRVPVQRTFRMPQLETFNGFTDPLDHQQTYKSRMHLQAILDAIVCGAFPVILKGNARTRYNKLQPGSIHTFAELSRSFVSYFIRVDGNSKCLIVGLTRVNRRGLVSGNSEADVSHLSGLGTVEESVTKAFSPRTT